MMKHLDLGSTAAAAAPQSGRRRAVWFMIALWLLLVSCITLGANMALEASHEDLLATLERRMTLQVQERAAAITVWYGGLEKTAETFAAADPVRLYAAEADAAGKTPGEELTRQTRFMTSQLRELCAANGFSGAALYVGETRAPLIAGAAPPTPEIMLPLVKAVRASGETRVLPVRLDVRQQPILDMLIPVYAPRYVDASGRLCVAVLLVSLDAADRARVFPAGGGMDQGSLRVVQVVDDQVRTLPTAGMPARALGEEWNIAREGQWRGMLPLALRKVPFPGGAMASMYTLGLSVPTLPWLVVMDVPESMVYQGDESFRNSVILVSALLALLVSLALFMVWWWLFERRERLVAEEMRRLYKMVNRQKQLLDGINASMQDGMALCLASGRISYANAAFARMAGESLTSITRKDCHSLLFPDLSRSLSQRLEEALRRDAPLTVTESLDTAEGRRRYQLQCAPYRAVDRAKVRDAGVVFVFRDISELLAVQERSRHMISKTVEAFVRSVEAVDTYLHGQASRTAALSASLARLMGRPEMAPTLSTAANLSQVGMIRLPPTLLTKSGVLTPAERAELEKHVEYALSSLEGIDFGLPVLEAIAHMHENMDGSGYPKGLSGEAICLEGRILNVASAFCAMQRPRSYRRALRLEESLHIFRQDSRKYDQHVVDALHEFLKREEGMAFLAQLTAQVLEQTQAQAQAQTQASVFRE